MIHYSYTLQEIQTAAKMIVSEAQNEKIWIFQGEMGAGKTTLIKALAGVFGIQDQVSSPTFGIVNQYENEASQTFYHFDFYRIEDPMEALDIGIEEYFYSGNYCWLEWAEQIAQFLPDQFFLIRITSDSDEKRTLNLQHINNAS
ncbi:MAG: tRNA (adenosine(37)-N6)-threonylcarbamoyltransferase complex ATPase subunit type 1 TsaE [Algoriphagus sp.]|uniref:tRNA (adenosine(37)-N6)-threonylcarbamoyltransferase complex ATPase subunit type 1 TsaE n=1 Tax=Algoriphagus sp. TaxID=1872435 RepID=UPI002626FB39|nr:tRNA (adenosine(37)-N6)-threonylcarbamoyltransferase complex ATPase subunit type 1 TsaE [Algoriphagus sp.]MDG1276804.1 tRNA (adenosine(37)-N6)-threonylcarbamoyltransferase complex ATPase subunit type 1 TsaE [Algoriphagus sp.]